MGLPPADERIDAFVRLVTSRGGELYRDFPWRRTRDPYAVLVSEVMLQQTQVSRVVPYFETWMESFPTLESLAGAPLEAVLRAWKGLGYNRRAIALKRAAEEVVSAHVAAGGPGPASLPRGDAALLALPGVGPATAAGVRSFAFGESAAYLETNVRAVFLHELFSDRDGVPDSEVMPLVKAAAERASSLGVDPRAWNLALLDYGAFLKRELPNPSRRSAHHTRQSAFEGSRRQKRAGLLQAVLDAPGSTASDLARGAGLEEDAAREILDELAREGFIRCGSDGGWRVT